MTASQMLLKRSFDVLASFTGLVLLGLPLGLLIILARLDTGGSGIFSQVRVGRYGELFTVYKLRTMRLDSGCSTTVTTSSDPRITRLGRFLRVLKLDELPQLWNVLKGDMSFVGPRPDVPGFADRLVGEDRIILSVRPGITGPATLAFRNEEALLEGQIDPETYNSEVLYPAKVRINRKYVLEYRFRDDLLVIFRTIFSR
jgi:lipopolysaccharide/colanic/teichoic acid biosynthesis glycosyltransferase